MTEEEGQGFTEGFHSRTKRQEQIAEYLLQHPSVAVQELADLFNVSSMTVYRDMDELERQGILRKVRGGATAQPSSLFESDLRYRVGSSSNEKLAIAQYAVQYVQPGQAVMMDDSTTALELARQIKKVTPLTVITNSLPIIQELLSVKGIRLISLGGEYLPHYSGFAGIICEQAINSLHANVLFMSVSAVSDNIAFHQEQGIVKVKQAMMNSVAQRILLVDHNKFHKIALHRLAPLDQFNLVIVDSGLDQESLEQLQKDRIKVEVAPV